MRGQPLSISKAEGPNRARELRDAEGRLVGRLHRRSKTVIVQRLDPWALAEVGRQDVYPTMAEAARCLGDELGLDGRDDYIGVADELSIGIFETEPAIGFDDLDAGIVTTAAWWAAYHRMSWRPNTDIDLAIEEVRQLDRRMAAELHWWRP